MRRRGLSTAAAALTFGVLLAFVLVSGRLSEEPALPVVVAVRPEEVQALRIERPGSRPVAIERRGGRWQIVQPRMLPTSDAAVDELLRSLSPLRAERVVARFADDLRPFGLSPPQAALEVTLADGATRTLLLGDRTPLLQAPPAYYASEAGAQQVFTVSGWIGDILLGGEEAFRERRLVQGGPDEVWSFVVQRRGLEMVVERASGPAPPAERRWRLLVPFYAPADAGLVEQVLRDLESARVERFENDEPSAAELARYGLLDPQARVQLRWQDASGGGSLSGQPARATALRSVTLLIGRAFQGRRYVRVMGQPSVYVVDEASLEGVLSATPKGWVRRQVVGLAADEFRRIALFMAGRPGPVTLMQEGATWRLEPFGRRVDDAEVGSFIEQLRGLSGQPVEAAAKGLEALQRQGQFGELFLDLTIAGSGSTPPTRVAIEGPPPGAGGGQPVRRVYAEQQPDRLLYEVDASALKGLEVRVAQWTAP